MSDFRVLRYTYLVYIIISIAIVTHKRWPSAFANAQWAAVRITLRDIIDPVHGYATFPVFWSAKFIELKI